MPNPPVGSQSWSGSSPVDVRSAVVDALRSGAAAVCVTGGASSGKTALCKELAAGVDDRSFSTGLFDPLLDPNAVLLQLLRDFGLGTDGAAQTRDALIAALIRFLKSLKPLGAHAIIVVDDADHVGVDVFATLVAVARGAGDGALRVVLVGQPDLDARLLEPPLSEFPRPGHTWTRIGLAFDDALVPVIPPESSYVAAIEPEPDAPTGRSRSAWTLPLLLGLLVVAGAARWWMSREKPPAAVAPPPAVAQSPAAAPEIRVPAAVPPAASAPTPTATTPPSTPSGTQATTGDEATNAVAATAAPSDDGRYRITVASFRTAARAEQVAAALQAEQLAVTTRADGRGTWFQVVAGPYASIESARDAQRTLERVGFPDTQISMTNPAPTSGR